MPDSSVNEGRVISDAPSGKPRPAPFMWSPPSFASSPPIAADPSLHAAWSRGLARDRCAGSGRSNRKKPRTGTFSSWRFANHLRNQCVARAMEGARRVPGWTPVDFFILRHGQTTWNARGIIQGQADAPLDLSLIHI